MGEASAAATMKLILSLSSIWTLLSTAEALQCLTCTDPTDASCASTASFPCYPQECVTANIGGQRLLKACAPASICPAPGSQTFSFSSTGFSSSIKAQCCNTDNCNTATVEAPAAQSVNNLQCYSCDSTNTNCSIRMQCKGVEDRCFNMNVTVGATTVRTLGCASANVCAATSSLSSILGSQDLLSMSCCQNTLCNSAAAATTTAACVLLGLLVFSLY